MKTIFNVSLCVLASLLLPSGLSRADLILGNLDGVATDTDQEFVLLPDSAISFGLNTKAQVSIDSVEFYLKANNQQTGFNATLKLLSDDNNKPGATLATFNSVSIPASNFSRLAFTPAAPMLLGANTTYWFTLESNFTAARDAMLIGARDPAVDPSTTLFASYAGTRFGPSNNQSGVFPFAPTFQVNGITAVPEPSSFTLALLPLIYLASRQFRRAGPMFRPRLCSLFPEPWSQATPKTS